MKKSLLAFPALALALAATLPATAADKAVSLKFNPQNYTEKSLTMPDGSTVRFRAYEQIFYVKNVEDPTYQTLNVYIPEALYTRGGNADSAPIFLKTNIGGYMAVPAGAPRAFDVTGRALQEGFVVCIPGSRGRNSTVDKNGKKIYTGRAPAGLLDLKAAVRYLRHNDKIMPGNAEKIITDGTSAGGAMSSLLGATGNSPLYANLLKKMGAADARDDVFAAVCYCPITDLDHADMAYEWLFQSTNGNSRNLSAEQKKVSAELAAAFPKYLRSLKLKKPDGTPITEENYADYIKSFLVKSAQRARNEGATISSDVGVTLSGGDFGMPAGAPPRIGTNSAGGNTQNAQNTQNGRPSGGPPSGTPPNFGNGNAPTGAPPNGLPAGAPPDLAAGNSSHGNAAANAKNAKAQRGNAHNAQNAQRGNAQNSGGPRMMHGGNGGNSQQGEIVSAFDLQKYLNSLARGLKSPPAFDAKGVVSDKASPENEVFGDKSGSSANFTAFSAAKSGAAAPAGDLAQRIFLMNPMNFIDDAKATKAPHWYIRHGASDTDTSFCVPVNLATKLMNCGFDVDFRLPWGRPHSGDYNLDDLFEWIHRVAD